MSAALTIPPPRPNDDDEVRWALSTASSLMGAGSIEDALRWLRRAGESASELDDDLRAVELFKAAANLRTSLLPPAVDPTDPPTQTGIRALRPRADEAEEALAHESEDGLEPAEELPVWDDLGDWDDGDAASDTAEPDAGPALHVVQEPHAASPPGQRFVPTRSRPGCLAAAVRTDASRKNSSRTMRRENTVLGIGSPLSPSDRTPRGRAEARPPFDTHPGLGDVKIREAKPRRQSPSAMRLSATKFVVTIGDSPGELRLKAWTGQGMPEDRDAVAVIVPRSPKDAEIIDRILDATQSPGWELLADDEPTMPGHARARLRGR